MHRLEEELLNQRKVLLNKQNPKSKLYFETIPGNECIRVSMKISDDIFIDKDYSIEKFGFTSYEPMRIWTKKFLKKAGLKYKNSPIVSIREFLDKLGNTSLEY